MDQLYYYAFCIGYDFLNDYYKNSETPECDKVFEECKTLAKEFLESDEYLNYMNSAYDSLEEWIKNNKDRIEALHFGTNLFRTSTNLPYGTQVFHNGFICWVGDYNDDNINETIVEIYKSQKAYDDRNYIDIVSLRNDNLEENIKQYLDENYKSKHKERSER